MCASRLDRDPAPTLLDPGRRGGMRAIRHSARVSPWRSGPCDPPPDRLERGSGARVVFPSPGPTRPVSPALSSIIAFFAGAGLTMLATPVAIGIARRTGFYDR